MLIYYKSLLRVTHTHTNMPRRKADKPGPLVPCCLMPADESNSNSSDSNHSNAFNWVATQQPHSQNFQRQHSPHCRHSSLSQQMTPEQQTSSNEQRGRLLEFVERLSSTTSSIEMQMHTNKYVSFYLYISVLQLGIAVINLRIMYFMWFIWLLDL